MERDPVERDRDPESSIRFCGPYHVDPDAPDDPQRSGQGVCPPGAIFVGEGGITNTAVANAPVGATLPYQYNVFDYARDMVDAAALTVKCVGVACSVGFGRPMAMSTTSGSALRAATSPSTPSAWAPRS